jgi:hypothetical protein
MGTPVEGRGTVKGVDAMSYNVDFILKCEDPTTNLSALVSPYLTKSLQEVYIIFT